MNGQTLWRFFITIALSVTACTHLHHFYDPWTLKDRKVEVGFAGGYSTGNFSLSECARACCSYCDEDEPEDEPFTESNYEIEMWLRFRVTDFVDLTLRPLGGFLFSDSNTRKDIFMGIMVGAGLSLMDRNKVGIALRFEEGLIFPDGLQLRVGFPAGYRVSRSISLYLTPLVGFTSKGVGGGFAGGTRIETLKHLFFYIEGHTFFFYSREDIIPFTPPVILGVGCGTAVRY